MESLNREPLYEQLASVLRHEIRLSGVSGGRLPTEAALARRHGVGLSTVREALSILAREGLVIRSHGRGTFVADSRRVVGVLCDVCLAGEREGSFRLWGPHHIHAHLHRAGYGCKLYFGTAGSGGESGGLTCGEFVDDLRGGRLSAVICVAERSDRLWLGEAAKRSVPVIAFGRQGRNFPYAVDFGNSDAVGEVTEFMVANGRSRPAYIGWLRAGDDPLWSAANPPLSRQFAAAAVACGMVVRDDWIRVLQSERVEGAGWEGFRDLWMGSGDKPDAIYVSDEGIFRDVVMAVMELGIRVPEDLLIVTRSIAGRSIVSPIPYTRVEHNLSDTAALICDVAVRLIDGDDQVPAVTKIPLQWQSVPGNPALQRWYQRSLARRAGSEAVPVRRSDNLEGFLELE